MLVNIAHNEGSKRVVISKMFLTCSQLPVYVPPDRAKHKFVSYNYGRLSAEPGANGQFKSNHHTADLGQTKYHKTKPQSHDSEKRLVGRKACQ